MPYSASEGYEQTADTKTYLSLFWPYMSLDRFFGDKASMNIV